MIKTEEKAIILYPYGVGALVLVIIVSCIISFCLGLLIGWLIK